MNDERQGWTSASNAQADALCPGRHQAQKGIENGQSPDAAFGSRVHAALASGVDCQDPKEQDIVESCRKIEANLVVKVLGDGAKLVMTERRLWSEKNGIRHSGQSDVVWRKGGKALVIDRKSLAGEVPLAPSNEQLRDYAVLTFSNLPLLTEIAVAVVQPLATHSPEVCLYSKDDIERATALMWARVEGSNLIGAARVAGEIQCKYCRAKTLCLPYQQWATSLLPVPQPIADKPMDTWTGAECAMVATFLQVVEDWADKAKQHIKDRLEADSASVPGWMLKPGNTRSKITKPQQVFDRFIAAGGKHEQFMSAVTLAKGELEKRMAEVTGAKGKGLKDAMEQLLADCVEESQNAPSLARRKGGA